MDHNPHARSAAACTLGRKACWGTCGLLAPLANVDPEGGCFPRGVVFLDLAALTCAFRFAVCGILSNTYRTLWIVSYRNDYWFLSSVDDPANFGGSKATFLLKW